MNEKSKNGFQFGTVGLLLGIFFVIVSAVWVTMNIVSKSETSGDDITWVG